MGPIIIAVFLGARPNIHKENMQFFPRRKYSLWQPDWTVYTVYVMRRCMTSKYRNIRIFIVGYGHDTTLITMAYVVATQYRHETVSWIRF